MNTTKEISSMNQQPLNNEQVTEDSESQLSSGISDSASSCQRCNLREASVIKASSSSSSETEEYKPPHENSLASKIQTIHACPEDGLVHTKDYKTASDILQKHKIVWLCGPPCSGKTCTGQLLMNEYKKKGFSAYMIPQIKDLSKKMRRDQSVVLLDGALGEVSLNRQEYGRLRGITGIKNVSLVVTVYPHVLREILALDQQEQNKVVHESAVLRLKKEPFDRDTKARMLRHHLTKFQPASDDETENIENPADALSAPCAVFVPLLTRILLDRWRGQTAVAVFGLTMLGYSRFLYEPEETKERLEYLGLSNISSFDLDTFADDHKGFVLAEDGHGFLNRDLYNAVGLALGQSRLRPILLKVCDSAFLVEFVRVGNEASELKVNIPDHPADLNLLTQCVYDLIVNGQIPELCQHPCFGSDLFLLQFGNFCKKSKYYIQKLLEATDPVHKMPILYWSSWSPSPHLTGWIWQLLSETTTTDAIRTNLLFATAFACALFADESGAKDPRLNIVLDTLWERTKRRLRKTRRRWDTMNTTSSHCGAKSVILPFPTEKQLLCDDMKEKLRHSKRRLEYKNIHYLDHSAAEIPGSLLSVDHWDVSGQITFPGMNWYFPLRLVADRETGLVDSIGDTLLHAAVRTGNMDAFDFAVMAALKFRNDEKNVDEKSDEQAPEDPPLDQTDSLSSQHLLAQASDRNYTSYSQPNPVATECLVDPKNYTGLTPLHISCRNGMEELARVLVSNGADINARSLIIDFTPCHLASLNGKSSVVQFLISMKADINAKSSRGLTPLYLACQNGQTETAEILISENADVNITAQDGKTPLHIACQNGRDECVELLLERVTDVNSQTKHGLTPLHCACLGGHMACVSLLLETMKANINVTTLEGSTPLHLSCKAGQIETARFLIAEGSDPSMEDNRGMTPFDLVSKEDRLELYDQAAMYSYPPHYLPETLIRDAIPLSQAAYDNPDDWEGPYDPQDFCLQSVQEEYD